MLLEIRQKEVYHLHLVLRVVMEEEVFGVQMVDLEVVVVAILVLVVLLEVVIQEEVLEVIMIIQ